MNLETMVVWYVTLLVSLVVHEAAHALFALLGGDKTAYIGGQVSLNPVPHIRREPFGTVIVPIAMLAMSGGSWCMGWAYTPIDAGWAHRHPRRAALMSAAGPMANILLATIALVVLKLLVVYDVADVGWISGTPLRVIPHDRTGFVYATALIASVFLTLNLILAFLNLLPWPPLDGSGILGGLFPNSLERFYAFVKSQPFLMILGLVIVWQVLNSCWRPIVNTVADWI